MYFYNKSGTFIVGETINITGGSTCQFGYDPTICAWKTFTSGATSSRIAPGDVIRVAKSPAPVSIGNATWTNLSSTVTLATAQTLTVDNCETAWTGSTNITTTRETTTLKKQGSYCAKHIIGSSFTTGKIAYYALPATLNCSAYQTLSFWYYTSASVTANYLKVCLCSDTAGNTIVDTFYIPLTGTGTAAQLNITKNGGGNMGSSINSIAIYAETDPGTPTIYFDNFFACTTNGLNLQSLISKNSNDQYTWGNETWYGIQSIDGTTIKLDNWGTTLAGTERGYYGTTETVATYRRETIKATTTVSNTSNINVLNDSGTNGNYIEYSGGWSMTTNTQNGETFFDGQWNWGACFATSTAQTFNKLNRFGAVRYWYPVLLATNSNYSWITNCTFNNNYYSLGTNLFNVYLMENIISNNNGAQSGNIVCATLNNIISDNNLGSGLQVGTGCILNTFKARNNGAFGVYPTNNPIATLKNLETASNASGGIGYSSGFGGILYLINSNIADSTEIGTINYGIYNAVFSQKHDQTAGNNWAFFSDGNAYSQTTTRHTASGIAWKIIPGTTRILLYPIALSIAKIAVNASALVTVKVWAKKDHATNVGAKLVCRGGQIGGVASDVVATKADDTNWEELTITFTPSEDGVVEIEGWGYYISGASNVYFDDMTITQA
jgi:hypothetical protein